MNESTSRGFGIAAVVLLVFLTPEFLSAQIDLRPGTMEPAAWERIALRVVNQEEAEIVRIRLFVPDLVTIMGVESGRRWAASVTAGTDTTPQHVEWSGGRLSHGEFREFAVMGRLAGDARRRALVFPVVLERTDGSVSKWGTAGAAVDAPRIQITSAARITLGGAVGLSGLALAVAVVALALAVIATRRAAHSVSG